MQAEPEPTTILALEEENHGRQESEEGPEDEEGDIEAGRRRQGRTGQEGLTGLADRAGEDR